EGRDAHARALRLGRIHERTARVSDEIRLPRDEPAALLALVRDGEVVRAAVVALIEAIVAAEDEVFVMQQVDHDRRARDREQERRPAAAVVEPVPSIERHREEASLLPLEVELGCAVVRAPYLRRAGALE